jgi:hypothetical protein
VWSESMPEEESVSQMKMPSPHIAHEKELR